MILASILKPCFTAPTCRNGALIGSDQYLKRRECSFSRSYTVYHLDVWRSRWPIVIQEAPDRPCSVSVRRRRFCIGSDHKVLPSCSAQEFTLEPVPSSKKTSAAPFGSCAQIPSYLIPAVESETMKCEGCQMAKAVVYVSESQAALCTGCSSMMGNVSRFQLCALCDRRPATTFCRQDNASLCSDCDLDIHLCNPVRHTRTPLEPISSESVKVRRRIACEEADALFT